MPVRESRKSDTYLKAGEPEEKDIVVSFEDVGLFFRHSWTHSIFKLYKRNNKDDVFWALRRVSFNINKGEFVGIIGRNGSGKSTCLYLINDVYKPDEGMISRVGNSQLLSIGVGFRANLTGRENLIISGGILGISKSAIQDHMEYLEGFLGLGDFLDRPVSTYSAGMRARLGFAISTVLEPDILLIDEAMAPGDPAFRKRATERLQEMLKKTATIVVVSHDPGFLGKFCNRIIWFENGHILMDGDIDTVLSEYSDFIQDPNACMDASPIVTDEVRKRG